MNALLNYIIESLFCGALSYLLYRAFISKIENYSFQRVSLLILVLITVLFPFITIPVSNPAVIQFVISPAYITAVKTSAPAYLENKRWLLAAPLILYLSITILLLIKFYFELLKVFTYKKSCELMGAEDGYSIYSSREIESPFSFGRAVFISTSYQGDHRKMAIAHELSHIDRYHTLDVLFVNIVLSFVWFNPFLYIFKNKLIEVHEFQADMDVISSGINIAKYKELLFLSQFSLVPNVSNSLHKSLTIKRFFKMENSKQTKAGMRVITLFAAAVLLLFSVTSFSKVAILPISNDMVAPELVSPEVFSSKVSGSNVELSQSKDTTSKVIPFVMVEVKPKFQGADENAFTKWVAQKLVYPEKAVTDSIKGRVILQFTVAENGKVEGVKVVRGVHPELDKEAVRVVSLSPDWEPGKQKGKNVRVVYTFPVIFQLHAKK